MANDADVVIVGAGPAGCALASLLAEKGVGVVLLDDSKRPELLVGESLVPAVLPVLQKLGIEERVAQFSTYKPGVSFYHSRSARKLHFNFLSVKGILPTYAYNVPRPEFDNLLTTRAEELGVRQVKCHAGVEKAPAGSGREIQLDAATLATAGLTVHPKLLVDASGRSRLFARTLDVPSQRGDRLDVAYFAHFENWQHPKEEDDGQVIITMLERGWSWRIPLPGRMSVGVVLDKEAAEKYGKSKQERLENVIASEPLLAGCAQDARRVSEVMTYGHYQLITERGSGPGWVMMGDAFGFVDPMLSPGLYMALVSAELLDRVVFAEGTEVLENHDELAKRLRFYETETLDWHACWKELIQYFYDGRIFSLYEAGTSLSEQYGKWQIPRLMERHMTKHIAAMASGAFTRRRYSRKLLKMASKHMAWDVSKPEDFAI